MQKQMSALSDVIDKLSGEHSGTADKVEGMAQTLAQNQETFDNVHRMFFIWEERYAAFQRCEQRMNKLITERRVQDRRLLAPNPSTPRESSRERQGVQVVEPGPHATVRGLPGIAAASPPTARSRAVSGQRRRRALNN